VSGHGAQRSTSSGAAPLPALTVHGSLVTIAFAASDPLLVAGVLVVALVAIAHADAPRRLFLAMALGTGLAVAAINPIVAAQGDLILIDGPTTAILDFQVTLEELAYGLAAGARLAAVTLACGAFLGTVDRDRLLAAVARVAPRSALTVALAARLLPALRRDATAIGEAARLRGRAPSLRNAGVLVTPLAAAALERGLDRAEAMAARGYGAGPRTALSERPLTGCELAAAGAGLVLAAVAAAVIAGAAPYRWYPTLSAPGAASLGLAALTLAAGLAAVRLLRSGP
jgi:energy-coupling factor transport system permease protein